MTDAPPTTGAEVLEKGRHITGPERAKLIADLKKRYLAGESLRDIATDIGRSYGFVHRMLTTEARVKLRGHGNPGKGARS